MCYTHHANVEKPDKESGCNMIYPTLKATVKKGKIQLVDAVSLPENATLLVTVLDEEAIEHLNLGSRMAAALQDILTGRYTFVETSEALREHLDQVFSD